MPHRIVKINGGKKLKGTVPLSGSKNSSMPIIIASLLCKNNSVIKNIPFVSDIQKLLGLISQFGCSFTLSEAEETVNPNCRTLIFNNDEINQDIESVSLNVESKIRTSVLLLGPLLARFGKAYVPLPGGCKIGERKIDIHIDALEKMGAKIEFEGNFIIANTENNKKLNAIDYACDKVSVGATQNILMAATLAKGTTILRNAAIEPEIISMCKALNDAGAKIQINKEEQVYTIEGVEELDSINTTIEYDRIEAFTYVVLSALNDGNITILNSHDGLYSHIKKYLDEIGIEITHKDNEAFISIKKPKNGKINLKTEPYPGLSTDLQPFFILYLAVLEGVESTVMEDIFENRLSHAHELAKMGADITVKNDVAYIKGVKNLTSSSVTGTDLRSSATLMIASIIANGESELHGLTHLERGYEFFLRKLQILGADIDY